MLSPKRADSGKTGRASSQGTEPPRFENATYSSHDIEGSRRTSSRMISEPVSATTRVGIGIATGARELLAAGGWGSSAALVRSVGSEAVPPQAVSATASDPSPTRSHRPSAESWGNGRMGSSAFDTMPESTAAARR